MEPVVGPKVEELDQILIELNQGLLKIHWLFAISDGKVGSILGVGGPRTGFY